VCVSSFGNFLAKFHTDALRLQLCRLEIPIRTNLQSPSSSQAPSGKLVWWVGG
jgi:hypothetical protein